MHDQHNQTPGTTAVQERGECGMATAEYAVGTIAACAFAGLLIKLVSSGSTLEMLTGVETLKSMGAEHRAVDRWSNLFTDHLNVSLARSRLDELALLAGVADAGDARIGEAFGQGEGQRAPAATEFEHVLAIAKLAALEV